MQVAGIELGEIQRWRGRRRARRRELEIAGFFAQEVEADEQGIDPAWIDRLLDVAQHLKLTGQRIRLLANRPAQQLEEILLAARGALGAEQEALQADDQSAVAGARLELGVVE